MRRALLVPLALAALPRPALAALDASSAGVAVGAAVLAASPARRGR
jgi:hypothetical protein